MDAETLQKIIRFDDGRYAINHVFNYIHVKDRTTGEGWWVWNGKPKAEGRITRREGEPEPWLKSSL